MLRGMPSSPRLAEITPATFDAAIGIRVRPDQEHLVAPVVRSLAEAYVHPGAAWPRLITAGGRPVGFLMAFFDVEFETDAAPAVGAAFEAGGASPVPGAEPDIRSGLWRLAIAAGEQGRGFGRFAVGAVADEIRRRGGDRLTVCWHPGAAGPEGFYLGLGFRPTGETSGGQRVSELELGTAGGEMAGISRSWGS